MTRLFLQLIGAGDALGDGQYEVAWHWARPGVWYVGFVLLVPVMALVVWRHRRSLPHLSRRARTALSVCRTLVLLLLIVALAGPFVRVKQSQQQKPIVAMLLDDSRSMQLLAGPFDDETAARLSSAMGQSVDMEQSSDTAAMNAMSRFDLARQTLHFHEERLHILRQRFDLRYYRFARRPVVSDTWEDWLRSETRDNDVDQTAPSLALATTLRDAVGREMAACVVFSDGRWTVGSEPDQSITTSGGDAIPVWTVPIGSRTTMPDAVLLDVLSPRLVTEGDTGAVIATVASVGLDNRQVKVELLQGDQVLDTQTITLRDDQRRQVQLTYPAQRVGEAELNVRIASQPEERVTQNNAQSIVIETTNNRYKVLMLEAAPRWDMRFLDHGMRRDSGIEATLVMESALRSGDVAPADLPRAAGLPTNVDEWAAYHVVILGDVSTDLLTTDAAERLASAVRDKGVGLIVQPGHAHMPHAFADTALPGLLPVTLTHTHDATRGGRDAPAYAPFRMRVSAAGASYPAFSLYDSAGKNRAVWSRMPPFYWSADVVDARPGAMVLAQRHGAAGNRPLIVEQTVGKGRVLWVGFDSTYRWRANVGTHVFYRFWGQAIRRVAKSQNTDDESDRLEVTPTRAEPGEPIVIETFVLNRDGQPRTDATIDVRIMNEKTDSTLAVTLTRVGDGRYRAAWTPSAIGSYIVRHQPLQGDPLTSAVRVASSNREWRSPGVDRDALGTLAHATGGEMIELEQLATLPDRIQGEPTTITRRRDVSVWDNWLMLIVLVSLYCVDVGIRRMTGSM